MMAFAFTSALGTHNTDLITMAGTATATTIMLMNTSGTNGSGGIGTTIGTITIETTIVIDAQGLFSETNFRITWTSPVTVRKRAVLAVTGRA
jgi:hypothetical protein